MIDFAFTPEQEALRETLRRFALSELLPRYGHGDRTGEYPREQIKRVIALIGEEAGFGDEHLIYAGIVAEEVARGDFNCVLPSLAPLVFHQFIAEASDELKARWLPGLWSGDQMIGLCLTEPEAGSDMGAMRTRGERRGDHYVLNGEKNSVSFLNADVFHVFARTDPSSCDWRGLSAFLVPRETPGLTKTWKCPQSVPGERAAPQFTSAPPQEQEVLTKGAVHMNRVQKEYDATIIGGGAGGLAVGALLAGEGFRTLIVEKTPHLGGRYRSIEFAGCRVDNGVHIISGIFEKMEDARAKKVFVRLGLDLRQKRVKQIIGLVGKNGQEGIQFKERGEASEYFQFIGSALGRDLTDEEVAEVARVFMLLGAAYAEMGREHLQVSLDRWLREQTSNPVVLEVQDVVDQLAGMDSREWNVAQQAHTAAQIMMHGGVIPFWYPAEGTLADAIIAPLVDSFRRSGGDIVTDATVRKVVFEGGRATGAWITDNSTQTLREVRGRIVVCAVPIFQAVGFRRMLDESLFPPDWRESIGKLASLAHEDLSGFYLLKKPVIGDALPPWVHLFDAEYGKPAYVGDFARASFCGGSEPNGKQLVYSYIPTLKAVPFGLDTSLATVEKALARWERGMNKAFPGFSELVDYKTFALQLNCGRYSNALVPVETDVKCPGIEGLYFAGDSVRSCGTLASDKVFEVAELCADAILADLR